MSFIRPEAAQWLHRWRETLAGAAAASLGAYWTVTDNGALTIIGTVLTIGGALEGGSAAVSDVMRLDLDPKYGAAGSWIVFHRGGDPLTIPVNATGAEALFDVFASLPGIETGDLLAKLNAEPGQQVVIWERAPKRLH